MRTTLMLLLTRPLFAGNAGATIQPGQAWPMRSRATYRAVLCNMGNCLGSMQ